MIPYVLNEKYFHPTLVMNDERRKQIVVETRKKIIKRKEEYAKTHKEMLQ